MTAERVVVLVGSPKGIEKSASSRLARVVVGAMEKRMWEAQWIHIHRAVETEEGVAKLLDAIDEADLVLLASPLYVDSLPAPTILALERIAEHRAGGSGERVPRFASLINCGFVEPVQNATCQQILRQFSRRARLEWHGGISLGAAGQTPRRVLRALEEAGDTLGLDLPVSDAIEDATRKPVMSARFYVLGGNVMWRRRAKRLGTQDKLRDRPYKQRRNRRKG
jgi:hypothetical protein